MQSLQKCISKEVLPQEYGGECPAIHELHGIVICVYLLFFKYNEDCQFPELWLQKLQHHQELFDHLDTLLPPSSVNAAQENEIKMQENCVTNFQQLSID